MIVLPYLAHEPRIGARTIAHPTSAVIGRANIGPGCTLGPLSVVRADGNFISIGANCWFGEASTVHIASVKFPTVMGANVTIGRYGLVHACTIGDDCVVGEHAVVMDGAVVEAGSVIAAECVVPPGKVLEGGWIYAGIPAKPIERASSALTDELHGALRLSVKAQVPYAIASSRIPHLRHAPGIGTSQGFAKGVYVAPTASIAGNVVLAPDSSFWCGVHIDAGLSSIYIGEQSKIQDN